MEPEETFAREYREALGTGPRPASLSAQRVKLMEVASRSEAGPRWRVAVPLVAALAAVVAVTALTWRLEFEPTAPTVMQGDVPTARVGDDELVPSQPVITTAGSATVEFSDGSRVVLAEETRGVVETLSRQQTGLHLERGHLNASVQKQKGRSWTIRAGDFVVRVVGTEFSVDFDPEKRHFAVEVSAGRVLVFGLDLPESGLSVGAGERFERHNTPSKVDAVVPAPVLSAQAQKERRGDAPAQVPQTRWDEQARSGNYGAALDAANRVGFSRLTQELSSADLLLLANTARYAGAKPQAAQALKQLRQRFPGSPAATLAALYLARQSGPGNPGETARWLRSYLSESPRGELAASARVDLMNTLIQLGDQAGARQVAREYLKHHPKGSEVSRARALLEP